MNKNMCSGCEYLTKRIQISYYAEGGIIPLNPPSRKMKPFCKSYRLHLNYIERILEGDVCTRHCIFE